MVINCELSARSLCGSVHDSHLYIAYAGSPLAKYPDEKHCLAVPRYDSRYGWFSTLQGVPAGAGFFQIVG